MAEAHKPLEQMTAQERLDLGISYFKEGKFDEAIAVLKTISTSDIYGCMGKLNEATAAWSKVRCEDNPETYAWAQFSLGNTYKIIGKLGEDIAGWSNIRREHSCEAYAVAQYSLGNTHKTMDQLDDAIAAWSRIRRDDDPEAYAWAQ